MKKTLLPLILCSLPGLVVVAPAQDEAPARPQASAEAVQRLEDFEADIDDYVKAWRKEQSELAKKAAEEGGSMPAMRMRPDFTEFVQRLIGWADESGGEDAALYLTQVVQLEGLGGKGREAFERLLADHATASSWTRLGRFLSMLDGLGDDGKKKALTILAQHPDWNVRGWVVLATHTGTIEDAPRDSEKYKAARAALLAAAAKVTDAGLRDELESPIDLREKLGVGAVAPDIEGIDLDGVRFKLSDYKGKIVFLDFWGDW